MSEYAQVTTTRWEFSICNVRAGNSFGTISRDPDFESDFNSQLLPIVRTIMSVKAMAGCTSSCAKEKSPRRNGCFLLFQKRGCEVEMAVSTWHIARGALCIREWVSSHYN